MQVHRPAHIYTLQQPGSAIGQSCRGSSAAAYQMDSQQAQREFVLQYVAELNDLTLNSKVLINTLTMLAGDNLEAASSIAAAIEKHILTVSILLKPATFVLVSLTLDGFANCLPGNIRSYTSASSRCLVWHAVCTSTQAVRSVSGG